MNMQGIACWFVYRILPIFSVSLVSLLVCQITPILAQEKTSSLTKERSSDSETVTTKIALDRDERIFQNRSLVLESPPTDRVKSQENLNQILTGTAEAKISPEDWKYRALQALIERYDCADDYPEGQAITRSKFAQGLNSCLNRVSKIVAQAPPTSDPVPNQDLETIKQLQSEFATELKALSGKVDTLEAKVTDLQKKQFSTTAKLSGEALFVTNGLLSGTNVLTGARANSSFVFQDRVRLILSSSFTGKDSLRLIFASGNTLTPVQSSPATPATVLGGAPNNGFTGVTGTYEGLLSDFTPPRFTPNAQYLTTATYRTPLSDSTALNVFAQSEGVLALGLSGVTNPYFESSGANNSITRFGRRNPVYGYGDSGPGAAILHKLSPEFEIGVAYTAITGENPAESRGLFAGRYVAAGQLTYVSPDKNLRTALTYTNTYSPPGTAFGTQTGSNLSNSTTGYGTTADSYGLGTFYQVSPKFGLNAWVGYSKHNYLRGATSLGGSGDVWNWAVGAAFPDLFSKNSVLGILVGQEPKLTRLDSTVNLGSGLGVADRDNSYHIEAFYQTKIADNIEVTPALLWITAPNSDARNGGNVTAYLRTTFRF